MKEKPVVEVFQKLFSVYGEQHWWPAKTPFEVCVGAILTQNTAWKNVEKAIENLQKRNLLSPSKILSTPSEILEICIKPAGFYVQKSLYLKTFSSFLTKRGGFEQLKKIETGALRRELLSIKGIGRETADSILLYAFDKPSFVVDAYTKRLFFRLGISKREKEKYEPVKSLVEMEIPPRTENVKVYKELHALIVEHGKNYCRKSPLCQECPLKMMCSYDR